jgi:hypothetical protein
MRILPPILTSARAALFFALLAFLGAGLGAPLSFAQRAAFYGENAAPARTGPHYVALSWTQSTDPGVTSNDVDRATQTGGPYFMIYASSTPITSYIDTSCQGYCFYIVRASTAAGESGYSNEVSAYVP